MRISDLPMLVKEFGTHPLVRRRPWSAVGRMVGWRWRCALGGGPVAMPFVGGAKLRVRPGVPSLTWQYYTGLFDFGAMSLLLHTLRPEDTFVDVGAFAGVYTVLASGACGATTISLEPNPRSRAMLSENVALNGLEGRVTVMGCAAGNRDERRSMTVDLGDMNHVVDGSTGANVADVEIVRLDTVLAGIRPWAVKMDVEGYEHAVLEGAHGLLSSGSPEVLVLEMLGLGERYGWSDDAIVRLLEGYGYAPYEYEPFQRRLRPLPRGVWTTCAFVRNPSIVEQRARAAAPFEVLGVRV